MCLTFHGCTCKLCQDAACRKQYPVWLYSSSYCPCSNSHTSYSQHLREKNKVSMTGGCLKLFTPATAATTAGAPIRRATPPTTVTTTVEMNPMIDRSLEVWCVCFWLDNDTTLLFTHLYYALCAWHVHLAVWRFAGNKFFVNLFVRCRSSKMYGTENASFRDEKLPSKVTVCKGGWCNYLVGQFIDTLHQVSTFHVCGLLVVWK